VRFRGAASRFTRQSQIDGPLVADRAYSPPTGRISYRVVDHASEMFDPDAGKWVTEDKRFMINPLRNTGEAL
jgi:hypothetical protein